MSSTRLATNRPTSTAAAPVDPVSETPAPEPSSQAPEPSSPQPTTPPPQSSVEPTTPPAQSSQPPAESSQPPAPSSLQPTTQPPASSQQTEAPSPTPSPTPSPSPEASQQPTTPPASSVQQQSLAPSPTPSVAVSASAQDITSAIPDVTTTDAQGSTITSRPAYITKEITSVDGNGRVLTVTQIVHNPNGGNDGGSANLSGSDAFFDNTGAVAGTFVVVGLAVTAGIMAFIFFMLKRRRRQRLDRDVAAAAAAATAAHRSGFDDDDMDEKHNSAGYYGAATDIHGEPQPNMAQYDYEDPAGGYDHYATSMPIAGDRSSTATAAGLAGFGAQSAQHGYETQNGLAYVPEEYEHLADQPHQSQGGYNAVTRAEGPADGTNGGYYFDPKEASAFYAEESYGGYEEHPRPAHNRSDSHGSVARDQGEERGLKITNA